MSRRPAALPAQIPFLHEKQIEREVDLLLAEYVEIMGPITEPPVPIEELPGFCTLNFKFADLAAKFPFADVLGAIWFDEAQIEIESSLNPDLNPHRRGRYHFTLAHEVGHWRLHRSFYKSNFGERMLFDDGSRKPDVVCRSSERKKPVEWQADAFAANLLMPRHLVVAAWIERHGHDPVTTKALMARYQRQPSNESDEAVNALREMHCRPLADLFEVSPEAMRIRLETLKFYVKVKEPSLFD